MHFSSAELQTSNSCHRIRLHILTRNGARCDSAGTLGFKEFENCNFEEIHSQRKLAESMLHESFSGDELAQLCAIKVFLHEVLRLSGSQDAANIVHEKVEIMPDITQQLLAIQRDILSK